MISALSNLAKEDRPPGQLSAPEGLTHHTHTEVLYFELFLRTLLVWRFSCVSFEAGLDMPLSVLIWQTMLFNSSVFEMYILK